MSWTPVNTSLSPTWNTVPTDTFYTYFLLLEDGGNILLEDGSKLVSYYQQPLWPSITIPASGPWVPV